MHSRVDNTDNLDNGPLTDDSDACDGSSHLYSNLFERLLESSLDDFDAQLACKEHRQLLVSLIRSDVQNLDAEDNPLTLQTMNEEKKEFPAAYSGAIEFCNRLFATMKTTSHPAFSAARFIFKKEGLKMVRTGGTLTVREIVESKRKVERTLSLMLVLLIGYRCSQARGPDTVADLLYFSKILLERVPVQERHFSLLLLCRGIIAPPCAAMPALVTGERVVADDVDFFAQEKASVQSGVVREARRINEEQSALSHPSLSRAFADGMCAAGIEQPSSTARLLFPFVAFCARHWQRERQTAQRRLTSLESDAGDLFFSDGDESLSSLAQGQQQQQRGEEEEERRKDVDAILCKMLAECIRIDQLTERNKGLTGAGDEMMQSMRRWLVDFVALHFIGEFEARSGASTTAAPAPASASASTAAIVDTNSNSGDILPEEVRRNTVAMELLSTSRALCLGRKSDRASLAALLADLGGYVEEIASIFSQDAARSGSEAEPVMATQMRAASDVYSETRPIVSANKAMTAVSLWRALPSKHRLKRRVVLLSSLPETRDAATGKQQQQQQQQRDEDLWGRTMSMGGGRGSSSRGPRPQPQAASRFSPLGEEMGDLDFSLLRLIGETLRLDPDKVAEDPAVRSEADFVFSTWRRPSLLFDYYRLHASTPAVQQLYRRFLKALLGVSSETVDGIRGKDPGNRAHLSRFPRALVDQWLEGRTAAGDVLPGFNDAQTLFMLGEDSNTCMMIRARQKGTNRGLLAFLLHGSVRVLGRKDSAGRLLERAVVHLAVDETTQRPVLYVETPFAAAGSGAAEGDWGAGAKAVEVFDQAAELGELLALPVVYACSPDPRFYIMGPAELEAVGGGAGPGLDLYDGWLGDGEGEGEGEEDGLSPSPPPSSSSPSSSQHASLVNISDYTSLSPYVWVDGIRDRVSGRFLPGRSPLLSRRSTHPEAVCIGARASGSIERLVLPSDRGWVCGPSRVAEEAAEAEAGRALKEEQLQMERASADENFVGSLAKMAAGPIMRRAPVRPSSTPDANPINSNSKNNKNSMIAKLIARNEFLADRTRRSLRLPPRGEAEEEEKDKSKAQTRSRKQPEVLVNSQSGEVVHPPVVSVEEEKEEWRIFDDDSDDLFG